MLTAVPCNLQLPSCLKVFDLFLLLRSSSIKESLKPRSSCFCRATCSEMRASPLQRTFNLALQEYFSLFESLYPGQEDWFESSFPAQQVVSGCFETWKHSVAGMVVHVSDSWARLRGCVLAAVGLLCSVSWHKQLEQSFWLGVVGNLPVCLASNLCLAASFLKELNAAELVSLAASTVLYLAVK